MALKDHRIMVCVCSMGQLTHYFVSVATLPNINLIKFDFKITKRVH